MKKILAVLVFAAAVSCSAQLKPPATAAYCMYNGGWIAMASPGSGTPLSFTPPAQALYAENGTSWYAVACDANGNITPGGAAGGDLSGTYPNPTVVQIEGAAIPDSKTIVGTNLSGQIVDASSATLANNTTGSAATLASQGQLIPSVSTPASPGVGSVWLSNSIVKLTAPKSPLDRHPLGSGQEQNVFSDGNGNYWDICSCVSNAIGIRSIPATDDPTASAVFVATISGTTMTVQEPSGISNTWSPDLMGPIQAGMTVDYSTGAVIQAFGTGGTTGTGGAGTYALSTSLTANAPQQMTASFWTVPTALIGNGAGGVNATTSHSFAYIEGSNLYLFFIATSTSGSYTLNNVYVATGTLTSPSSLTPSSTAVLGPQGAGMGTVDVIKYSGTYYMFQEFLGTTTNPVEGSTENWLLLMATSSTVNGSYAVQISPLLSTLPTPNGSSSHPRVYQEGSNFVMYYHAAGWGRSFPTDLYRATTTNLACDCWALTNNRAPIAKRRHAYEVDQLADPFLVQWTNGVWYLFYTAMDNRTGPWSTGGNMMVMAMQPTLYQYDGVTWQPADSGHDVPDWVWNPSVQWNIVFNPLIDPPIAYYGAWTPTAVSGAANGGALVSDGNVNDYIQYDVMMSPGTHLITLTFQTGSTGGIITPMFDGGQGSFGIAPQKNTNLLTWSNTFTNSVWVPTTLTAATTAATTDPFGGGNAWIMTASSATSSRTVEHFNTVSATDWFTLSAYMKAGTVNGFLALDGSSIIYATYTLSGSGSCAQTGGGSCQITSIGNGWYRCSTYIQNPTAAAFYYVVGLQDGTGTYGGYPKNSTNGGTLYVYGAQLEQANSIYGTPGVYSPVLTSGNTCDTYSASTAQNVVCQFEMTILGTETYRRRLQLKMATKNSSSSSYVLALQGLAIQRIDQ